MILIIISALLFWYVLRALRTRCSSRIPLKFGRIMIVVLLALVLYVICAPKRSGDDAQLRSVMWALFAYISVFVPVLLYVVLDLVSRVPELFRRHRWKWLGRVGALLALFSFGAVWWGALYTARHTEVRRVEVYVPGLPESFDGYTIAQFSDFHTGTYGTDTTFVSHVVNEINALHPDLICFTGDIVNRRSSELRPFTSLLSKLHAPDGVYSVLGNHDYGDYLNWPDSASKAANLEELKDMQQAMGWRMLNNATDTLRRSSGADSIMLIGVENVGDPPFHTYGNLDVAYPGDLDDSNTKILLSHNPAHWLDDIKDAPDKNIALTLSGHTHAMQMRFLGWSPAVFRYSTWGGLYPDNDGASQLYVNIGLGEVGFPARIGATPEITLVTLRKK
ncbi:MAG: metallophosphoesterase [Muribaculaceae bacterium]|nr:metallophosphoesterase [Muribaculaceae bacterium]